MRPSLRLALAAAASAASAANTAAAFTSQTASAPFVARSASSAASSSSSVVVASSSSSSPSALAMSDSSATDGSAEQPAAAATVSTREEITSRMSIPLTFDEMVRQAAGAMEDAYDGGKARQMIRVLLPRDPTNDQIGQYLENDADVDTANLVLAPPDETWQGGIMQLYRAAAPTCQEILRRFSRDTAGVPPKMIEDRSVDESGVDGVGLWLTQSSLPLNDVSCFVQPTQETVDAVETIHAQAGPRLVALMNPQWRNADDALDAASKSGGVLGGFASFLGGKGRSLERLDRMGFVNVYTLEGYVCKGGNVRMVKRFDSDWAVFAENDAGTGYVPVGTSEGRPTYQDVEAMLDDKGIALKYARDIGLAPKI